MLGFGTEDCILFLCCGVWLGRGVLSGQVRSKIVGLNGYKLSEAVVYSHRCCSE